MTEASTTTNEQLLEKELHQFSPKQIRTTLSLLSEGNTVPFIARYRKEATGSLDEVEIRLIEERYHAIETLEKRKTDVIRTIEEQGKLTEELKKAIQTASKMQAIEDLYRPFKQKRRTKAMMAKEKGLEPLADWLVSLKPGNPEEKAAQFVQADKEVASTEEALAGAHEILAERFADVAQYRTWIRSYTYEKGEITSQRKKDADDEKQVFENYYAYQEPLRKLVSHRILALNRGERLGILTVKISVDETMIERYLARHICGKKPVVAATALIEAAYLDAYKRFIAPAIEREIRAELTEKADAQAIAIFGENLKNLLLQAPVKGKNVLGFDPAYRTGCKLAVVDETGKVLAIQVIYPHNPAPAEKKRAAGSQFKKLIEDYQIDLVAIGNGTASRESEQFVAEQLREVSSAIYYTIVSEAGASVYSASDVAREEFPDLQVEERSAVSIARRVQDPLAELVKIDPKAVGVGQYQHDVRQKELHEQLDFVVETAVNQVGADLNTASAQLLQYVAGLNKTIAQNVVAYRNANGEFTSRQQLKKVPRLGPKAFEQSVGFLRILGGKNRLDQTAIHPESYPIAQAILDQARVTLKELGTPEAMAKIKAVTYDKIQEVVAVGELTFTDIWENLQRPGRDLRDNMPMPVLRQDVLSLKDLRPGMKLEGTVRNVVDFGAFVDIGVKQDGMVHLSRLSDRFVKHPTDVVAVGDIVTVWVEQIDAQKGRIALTMKEPKERKDDRQ